MISKMLAVFACAALLLRGQVIVLIRGTGGGGGGSITLLAGANGHALASGVNGATTAAINSTSATLILAAVSSYTGGPSDSFSDSKSNTWTPLTSYSTTAGADRITIYYVCGPTVGSGHTFTNAGTGNYTAIAIQAYSGTATTSCFLGETGANNVASSPITPGRPGSLTVTSGNLAVSALTIAFGTASLTVSVDLGYTITDQLSASGVTEGLAFAYLVAPSTGGLNPGWIPSASNDTGIAAAHFAVAP